jgi:hypothetical protein
LRLALFNVAGGNQGRFFAFGGAFPPHFVFVTLLFLSAFGAFAHE